MSTTKIQINSLEALERLLGNDTEFEMEIRSSIAAAFAEKHLKGMVRQMADAGLTDSVKLLIEQELYSTVPDPSKPSYYSATLRVFKPKVVEALRGELSKIIDEQVHQQVNVIAKEMYERLNAQFEKLSEQVAHSLLPRITDAEITERVKKKLTAL